MADDEELGEYLAHRMQRYLKNVGHLFEDHLGLHFKAGGFDMGTQVTITNIKLTSPKHYACDDVILSVA
jgi:hypothetical protein